MVVMPTKAQPRVYVDWYDDGSWADAIDDVTDAVLGDPGLSVEWGRDTARSTAPPMIGSAECALANDDRAFSPQNPATPRYQFVLPGRPFKIEIEHGAESAYTEDSDYTENDPYDGVGTFPLLLGHTSTFTQRAEWGSRQVGVTALDRMAILRRKTISVQLQHGPYRVDEAVADVLDAAGWPAADRVLRICDSSLNGWWVDERKAWDVLVELLASEGAGAVFYVDPLGVFHFLNRNHRALWPRSTVVQAAFHDGTGTGIPYSRLEYDPRWEDVVDRVTVTTKQRELAAGESVIWKLGTTITVSTGEVRTIWARPTDPFQLAVAPVLTTDYTVSGGTVTVALEWSNGGVAKIVVTGTSGVTTVTDLQLRGHTFPVVGETVIESLVDTPSTTGDARTLDISAWPELVTAQAQAIADSYVARYGESRPILTLTFQNVDGDAMDTILALRVSDRIAISNEHFGLVDFACYVERLRHQMTTGGRHELTLWCEPVSIIGSVGDAWDTAVWESSVWGI